MLGEISSRQFAEWMGYARLEPFGEDRDDLRMGIIASTIANANRGKGGKAFTPQQFMPQYEEETEEDAQARLVTQAMMAFGGKR